MLRRFARWILRDELARVRDQGKEEGSRQATAEAVGHIASAVRDLLRSGHLTYLRPYLRGESQEQPEAFVRPRELFHLLAAEVQMSDAPNVTEEVECDDGHFMASEAVWARARAIDQLLPKLARLIDAKMSEREAIRGMPGRRRYTVAVSVQSVGDQ